MPAQYNQISQSTRWEAFIGTLPFLAFGIVSIIDKVDLNYDHLSIYTYLAFYILSLSGLLISWVRELPLWSYGYLGWVLVFTWWWSNASINGIYLGYIIWAFLGLVVLIALSRTRSLNRITRLFRIISRDWTRLSLAIYAFISFVYLIYDENHHPYLLIFMSASTVIISAGVWFFLRSASLKGRVLSIWGGFIVSHFIGQLCDNTWDAAAYYGLPDVSTPWYMTVFRTFMILSVFSVLLLWPAAIGVCQQLIRSQKNH
jgi:hypothetical protein